MSALPIYFRFGDFVSPALRDGISGDAIGFQFYLVLKRKLATLSRPAERWQVIAAAVFGAALGVACWAG